MFRIYAVFLLDGVMVNIIGWKADNVDDTSDWTYLDIGNNYYDNTQNKYRWRTLVSFDGDDNSPPPCTETKLS